jgi:replicative DNA helicase
MTNDKIRPHQHRIMDMLKEEVLSPTGRIVKPEPELQTIPTGFVSLGTEHGGFRRGDLVALGARTAGALSRRIHNLAVFAAMYGRPQDTSLETFLNEMPYPQLEERLLTIDSYSMQKVEWLGDGPEQDFNKAKTPKKQLEARLHKKDKPKVSSLLSKLVKKT